MKSKSLRLLIVPNARAPYDQRMVRGLAGGFHALGHQAFPLSAPLTSLELNKICSVVSPDVVIQINRVRDPEHPLPSNVRHIAWFQDVFPSTMENLLQGINSADIFYMLGDREIIGIDIDFPCYSSYLFTAVDNSTLHFSQSQPSERIDFSLCGFIPKPINPGDFALRTDMIWYLNNLVGRIPLLGDSKIFWLMRKLILRKQLPVRYMPYAVLLAFNDIVRGVYQPLRGNLDIHQLATALQNQAALFGMNLGPAARGKAGGRRKNANQLLSLLAQPYRSIVREKVGRGNIFELYGQYLIAKLDKVEFGAAAQLKRIIDYYSREYPRLLDRELLINEILSVSQSLELYGPGWQYHEKFKPYYKGILDEQYELLRVFQRSRINLANNTHGLGLHGRTLECMAVGGFIFMHSSPHDNKIGGMHTSFEPGIHYGTFTPENLVEEAQRWLREDKRREEVGQNAAAIIREKHRWHHRAQQIIDDLRR